MVLLDSVRVSRDRTYSGYSSEIALLSNTGLSPSVVPLSNGILLADNFVTPYDEPHNPAWPKPHGLGYFRFARRYSGSRYCFPLLRVLRCFSSPRSPRTPMDSVYGNSGIPGSMLV